MKRTRFFGTLEELESEAEGDRRVVLYSQHTVQKEATKWLTHWIERFRTKVEDRREQASHLMHKDYVD
jgi:hypothetical protein